MTRHHGLSKDATQRLLDLAVEDNLVKLETKIGTKGNKNGIEERAYRLPTHDMLPKERYDWYCFHCHNGGEVVLCTGCHRVYHESCLKEPLSEVNDFFCNFCKIMQKVPEVTASKRDRKDLNHLLSLCVKKLSDKMPGNLMAREPPVGARNSFELPERPPKTSKKQQQQILQQQQQLQQPQQIQQVQVQPMTPEGQIVGQPIIVQQLTPLGQPMMTSVQGTPLGTPGREMTTIDNTALLSPVPTTPIQNDITPTEKKPGKISHKLLIEQSPFTDNKKSLAL